MMALPRIPGYELLACLGGGQITSVYAARALGDDSPCAVKVLRADWQQQPTAIKLLQREARACLAVQHPHLVGLRQIHVTRPPYFLVMDQLPGESLRRRLRRDFALDVPTTLWIIRQTAEALAVLHHAGFIHGDVKPDNIRLVRDGHVILLDLGFAHHPGENASLLMEGFVLGTVNYLAPEQCQAQPSDDYASDIFSLGVTMFEMLTGQMPYPGGAPVQAMSRREAETPQDIRNLMPDVPPPLCDLVNRLLTSHPKDRPKISHVVQQLIPLEIAAIRREAA